VSAAINNLWLVPVLPLIAAGLIAFAKRRRRKLAATLAVGAMVASFVVSCIAFVATLVQHDERGVRANDRLVTGVALPSICVATELG